MASSLAPSSQNMPRSKKFSNNFDRKIRTFWEYFIFLCQAIQKYSLVLQFTKFEIKHTMNSLCHCAARQFANQGAQNCVMCTAPCKGFLVTQTRQLHFHTLVEPQTLQITTLLIIWR